MVQHHSQLHSRQPSLFAGGWRHLLPRADDPAHLLSLKVKALSACLAGERSLAQSPRLGARTRLACCGVAVCGAARRPAANAAHNRAPQPCRPPPAAAVGIGRADEVCPLIFSWDGFWQAKPSDQQLRLATYALRMLASAAASYAALPADQVARCRRCASMSSGVASHGAAQRPAATPHFVKACLVSATMQLLATRPQYLPAVDAFLASCAGQSPEMHSALLNAADALFSAAAAVGSFRPLAPRPRAGLAISRQRGGGAAAAAAAAAPPGDGEAGSPETPGSPTPSGVSGMLRRMKLSMSKRLASFSSPGAGRDPCASGAARPPLRPLHASASTLPAAVPPCLQPRPKLASAHARLPRPPCPPLTASRSNTAQRRPRTSAPTACGRRRAGCLAPGAPSRWPPSQRPRSRPWRRRSRRCRWPAGRRRRRGCGTAARGPPSGAAAGAVSGGVGLFSPWHEGRARLLRAATPHPPLTLRCPLCLVSHPAARPCWTTTRWPTARCCCARRRAAPRCRRWARCACWPRTPGGRRCLVRRRLPACSAGPWLPGWHGRCRLPAACLAGRLLVACCPALGWVLLSLGICCRAGACHPLPTCSCSAPLPASLPPCSQYQGEGPGHILPTKEAGAAVLAICQAAAMTHLLIGPAGGPSAAAAAAASPAAAAAAAAAAAPSASGSRPKGGSLRGRTRMRTGASSDGSSVRGSSPAGFSAGSATPQWTLQQEEIARGLQAVMSALTSRFPSESVSGRAGSPVPAGRPWLALACQRAADGPAALVRACLPAANRGRHIKAHPRLTE